MKLLLIAFVICAVSASYAEEIETRKTVKKAAAIELKNEVESRTDLPEAVTVKVETTKETIVAMSTTTKEPQTTISPPASTTKIDSTTIRPNTVTSTSTTEKTTDRVTADNQITAEISTSSVVSTTPETLESNNSVEQPEESEEDTSQPDSNNIFQSVDPPKRKVIYVNQQQSGKLNVHLELSDVSVIVIPNQKDPQLSLLSLLFRSTQKSKLQQEAKKKEESSTSAEQHDNYSKYKQLVRPTEETFHLGATGMPFVESRAPYKVDISSTIGQQSQPAVDISPNAHQQSNPSAMPQFQPQFARSPIMQLLKPIPYAAQAVSGQMPHKSRIFKRSINSRLYRLDDEIPHDNENTVNYNEDELTESYLNSLNSLDNGEDLGDFENNDSEFVLLGAQENCGPDRKRNSYQICVSVANME